MQCQGKAESAYAKPASRSLHIAAIYVKDVEGVKDVENEMTVSEPQEKSNETPGEKIDDVSITVQVKMTLLLHRSTSALNTKVVSDIHGVKSVKNRMTMGNPDSRVAGNFFSSAMN